MYASEIARVSFELYYKLLTARNNKTILLAHAKTGIVCYDYTAKKIAKIPVKLRNILDVK